MNKGNPTCRVYLLRHAEVANAQEPVFNGHFDVGLSPHGRDQVREVAEAFKNVDLQAVHCSTLRRTLIGAETIAALHEIQPVAHKELREISVGLWDGMTVREVEEKFPGEIEKRLSNLEEFKVDGGESYHDLADRVLPRFKELVSRHQGETILIMAHGGVNRIILADILGIPLNHIFNLKQDFVAVNVIQYYENTKVVELINGTHKDFRGIYKTPAGKDI